MGVVSELIKVRKVMKQPVKDASNPQFRSSYVTYDAVVNTVDSAIAESKAEMTWAQEIKDEQVFTLLMTEDDKLELGGVKIIQARQQKGKGWVEALDPQAQGSGLTYAKRYSLALAFGVASDVDDDANSAQSHYQNNQRSQSPNQGQPKNQLNSIFGGVSKSFREKNNFSEEAMYQAISQQFNANINNFYAFNKLNDQQKEAVINWLRAGVN